MVRRDGSGWAQGAIELQNREHEEQVRDFHREKVSLAGWHMRVMRHAQART
jgi:hypothetical protein